ncbi:MAG: PIN domain-containing protein, partial [Acidobacteriota bacterium]
MRILFDLNVLLDASIRWRKFPGSLQLYNRVLADAALEGAFPGCGYTTLYYILKQELSDLDARAVVSNFATRLKLLPFTPRIADHAQRLEMPDLEGACVAATALHGHCSWIATRDPAGFRNS